MTTRTWGGLPVVLTVGALFALCFSLLTGFESVYAQSDPGYDCSTCGTSNACCVDYACADCDEWGVCDEPSDCYYASDVGHCGCYED